MKFSVGDRVEVIGTDEVELNKYVGEIGTVVFAPMYDDDFYNVTFDDGEEMEFYTEELDLE